MTRTGEAAGKEEETLALSTVKLEAVALLAVRSLGSIGAAELLLEAETVWLAAGKEEEILALSTVKLEAVALLR